MNNDIKIFESLFRKYFRPLCFYAMKIAPSLKDHEDIVSNSFLKFWEKWDDIENPEASVSYLYTIVRNQCLSSLRKKRIKIVEPNIFDVEDDEKNKLESLVIVETLRLLHTAAEKLPSKMRAVFKRYYINGETDREISEALCKSYDTVRFQRARSIVLIKEKIKL